MMLNVIHIENFKSYKKQSLHLTPLTLLIGANASGKSNAIEAFRFLSWLAEGQKLSSLKHAINDSEKLIRGNVRELFYPNQKTFNLGCEIDNTEKWNSLSISLNLRNDELHIKGESIRPRNAKTSNNILYIIRKESIGYSNDVVVAYNNFKKGQNPTITCTDQISIMNQLASSALFADTDQESQQTIPAVTKSFQEALSETLFLDPVPSKMRADSYPDKKLLTDGSNLAGVLYNLLNDEKNRENILEFIRSLPEQNIQNISTKTNQRGRAYFELEETFGSNGKKSWSAELLSDGTLRVLAIAVAILSVKEGTTVVIEEIDNGIHPSRAKQLMQTIQTHAQKRNLRLLLSTHNPALMDAIPDEALGDVVFCYRDTKDGDSRLVRLSDLDNYPGLLAQGTLGDLITKGILDRFVKNPLSPEDRKKQALDWLRKLQEN